MRRQICRRVLSRVFYDGSEVEAEAYWDRSTKASGEESMERGKQEGESGDAIAKIHVDGSKQSCGRQTGKNGR